MTEMGQEIEFNVLGCKVKYLPNQNDSHVAKAVIDLVMSEIQHLRQSRPGLKDTDVAVLIALKMAKEKWLLEDEYKKNILSIESSIHSLIQQVQSEVSV